MTSMPKTMFNRYPSDGVGSGSPIKLRLLPFIALMVSLAACGGSAETATTSTLTTMAASTTPPDCAEIDTSSRAVLYQAVQDGAIPAEMPPRLKLAMEEVPPDLLTSLLYAGCAAERVDDLAFERVAWTNGIGLMVVALQEWPGEGALVGLPFGGEAHQAGVVQVSAADEMANERTRVVHLFDGVKVVTVATFSLTTLSIEKVEEIAWAIFDVMPLDPSNRTGIGASRSLGDFLAAVPTNQITVGDPEGIPDLSPFTLTLGMAHATYSVTALGSVLTVFDFGAVGAADRAAAAISRDGYTIAHGPYEVDGTPRYWQWDRLIIQYMANDSALIERLDEVVGPVFAGGTVDS